jgi:hypothetical protein
MIYNMLQVVCWAIALYGVYHSDYDLASFMACCATYVLFYAVAANLNEQETQ